LSTVSHLEMFVTVILVLSTEKNGFKSDAKKKLGIEQNSIHKLNRHKISCLFRFRIPARFPNETHNILTKRQSFFFFFNI